MTVFSNSGIQKTGNSLFFTNILNSTVIKPPKPESTKAITATILNHAKLDRLSKAISILFNSTLSFPFPLYTTLLQICSSKKALVETRKLESHLITHNPDPPVFLLNRVIETYGKCGCLKDAQELFDEMPQRDGGSWNAMITAFTRNGKGKESLEFFKRMNGEGVFSSEVTFASVLSSCGSVLDVGVFRQVHGMVWKYGFVGNVILESSIVDVYGKCGFMAEARKVFDGIREPNCVTWNVIVRRYFESGEWEEAVRMFFRMVRGEVRPMSFTVSSAILACSSFGGVREGKQIHGFGVKVNMEEDVVVASTLIGMYAKCGDLGSARKIFDLACSEDLIGCTTMLSGYVQCGKIVEARKLFDQMPERSLVSWNVILSAYTHSFQWDKALDFVILMLRSIEHIDHVTLGLFLNLCAAIPEIELGKQAHGFVYRRGYYSNLFVGNALLDLYGKCGYLSKARIWFYEMSHLRDNVSWNALLTSYARHGSSEEAMMIFSKMLGEAKPSKYTFGTLLAACANILSLRTGKEIHGFMLRNDYDLDIVIQGALVDMYSKCRCISYATRAFNESTSKDVILYNTMILGCSHNGLGEKAVKLFERMEKDGVKPDHVTFQGILHACICEGQVELGRKYFESISDKYYLIPRTEHYEAMVELYGRYRFMGDLELFVKNMKLDPTKSILIKVFDFSRQYRRVKLGEWAAERLNELNPLVPYRFELTNNT